MVGTSQKWPAKAGGRSPKGPAVAGTTVFETINNSNLLVLHEAADYLFYYCACFAKLVVLH